MVRKFGAAAASPGGVAPLLGRRSEEEPHEEGSKAPRTARFSLKVRRRLQNHAQNNHNNHNNPSKTSRRMLPFVESRGGSDHGKEDADINNDYDDDPCSTLTPTYAESFAGRRRGHAQVVATAGMDIWTACQEGDVPYVSATVQRFPEFIHLEQRGRTPLYHACQNNHVAIAAMLLEAGATDWDGSCAQVTSSPVIQNLLRQYQVVEQQMCDNTSRSGAASSKQDLIKNLLPADTGLTAWEVCSLPGSSGQDDAFSYGGADDAQSHFSKPIERVLRLAAGTGDQREEPTPHETDPKDEEEEAMAEVSERGFVAVQESHNNDGDNCSRNEEPRSIKASGVEESDLSFGKVRLHFETVIAEKKKPQRRWLPKKLLSKKKDPVDVVETESQSQESRLYNATTSESDKKNEAEHMETSFLENPFPTEAEAKDRVNGMVEEKPVVDAAAPSAASVAATTIGTSTVTSAAVDSAPAAFAWSDQEILRIEAVQKNARWLALIKQKISPVRNSNNDKNISKATRLGVAEEQVEMDPPRWATKFVTSDPSDSPINEGAEILRPPVNDKVRSVASAPAKSSGTINGSANSIRPMESVDLLADLGSITASWFTFSKAKSQSDAAAAEEDAASIAKYSISNVTDGGVEVRDKRPTNIRAKSASSMTALEDDVNDEVQSVAVTQAKSNGTISGSADSIRPIESVDLLADLGSITASWFTFPKAKSHADAAAAEEDAASIAKHSISNVTDGGVEVRDKRPTKIRAKSASSMASLDDDVNDEVQSVAATQAKSNGTISGSADSIRPMESVDLGSITAGWFTFPKAKSHGDAAAAEEDAASIAKHSISNVTDGGVEVRDKRTSKTRAKSASSMASVEDEMASAVASATWTNDSHADLSMISDLGSGKDLTVSSRGSRRSLASKAASIAIKASKLTAMNKDASKSETDSPAVATLADDDVTHNGDEVASSKTWPGFEVAPKSDGSAKTWSGAAVPSLISQVRDEKLQSRSINKSKKSVKTAINKVFASVKGSAHRSVAVKEDAAILESPEKSAHQSDDHSVHSTPSVRSDASKHSLTSKQPLTDPLAAESDDEPPSLSNSSCKSDDVASVASSANMVDVVAAAGAALSKEAVSAIKDADDEASAETQATQSESEGEDDEPEMEEEVEVTLEDFGMYSLGQNLEDCCNHHNEEIRIARCNSAPHTSAATEIKDMPNLEEERANGDIKQESDVTVVHNPILPMQPILRNKQPVGEDNTNDGTAGPQQPRVDSQLSRFAQSFSTAADDASASEQEILDTPSVEETLESEEVSTFRTSQTSQELEGIEGESISSCEEDLSGNEDTDDDDDDEECDDDAGSVGSKTHASDATGFQLMGTASAVLVHPGDTFRAISEEISCILGNR